MSRENATPTEHVAHVNEYSRPMSSELGAWLRRQREERGWTRSEMARQLIKAAKSRGDSAVPSPPRRP